MRIFNFFHFVKLMPEKYQAARISGKCTVCLRMLLNPVHEGHRVFLTNGNFKKFSKNLFYFLAILFYSIAGCDEITLVAAHPSWETQKVCEVGKLWKMIFCVFAKYYKLFWHIQGCSITLEDDERQEKLTIRKNLQFFIFEFFVEIDASQADGSGIRWEVHWEQWNNVHASYNLSAFSINNPTTNIKNPTFETL